MVLPGGTWGQKASRHLNNTPSPVFCALNHLFKYYGCDKVVRSQFACQRIKRKQVNCSSETKPLSSKKSWKEPAAKCVWYTTETSFLSRFESRYCTGWSWWLKLPLTVVEPMLIYTIKSLFSWLFSTSDCTWQAWFILLNNKLDAKIYLKSSSKCPYILNLLLFSFSLPFEGVKFQVIHLLSEEGVRV